MIGIIVSGHGNFASGITSTLNLIAGKQENYTFVDFIEGMSGDILAQEIEKAIENLEDKTKILILTDILGGAPFRASSTFATQRDGIEVISGVNAQMLIEACLEREEYEDVSALAADLITSGREGISSLAFELKEKAAAKAAEETEDSGGI